MGISTNVECLFSSHESVSVKSYVGLKRKIDEDPRGLLICKCQKREAEVSKHDGYAMNEQLATGLSKFTKQNCHNFQRSGIPTRFLFYDNGEWKNFNEDAMIRVQEAFRMNTSCIKFHINGHKYVANFLSMWQLNTVSGHLRSLAWIDEHDRCFFPSKAFQCHINQLFLLAHNAFYSKMDSCVLDSVACIDASSTSSEAVTDNKSELKLLDNAQHGFALTSDRLYRLAEGGEEFTSVKDSFLKGLGFLAKYATITAVHNAHSNTYGQARLEAFQRQEQITMKARGDANLRHAWHGTSRQGVSGIILHGFGQPRVPKNGAMYGAGVYLSPEDACHISAIYSDADKNGEQHMLLCQVIMGNMEQVPLGSDQFHPRSEEFDTGVDDLSNPKHYIVWSTHMNTHIFPKYVVSFKLALPILAVMRALRGRNNIGRDVLKMLLHANGQHGVENISLEKILGHSLMLKQCSHRFPRSPWISFSKLFDSMKAKLPSDVIDEVQQWYLEFQAGQMLRSDFIKNLRSKVNDQLLRECITGTDSQSCKS